MAHWSVVEICWLLACSKTYTQYCSNSLWNNEHYFIQKVCKLLDNSGKDYNWFGVIFQWHIDQLWKSVDSLLAQKLTPSIVAIHYGIRNTILFKKYAEWMNLIEIENFIDIQHLLCKKRSSLPVKEVALCCSKCACTLYCPFGS